MISYIGKCLCIGLLIFLQLSLFGCQKVKNEIDPLLIPYSLGPSGPPDIEPLMFNPEFND